MPIRQEEKLNSSYEKYSNKLDLAIAKGDFNEALSLSLHRGSLQNHVLTRMEFQLKKSLVKDLAQKTLDYANTHKGFGFNSNTAYAFGNVASGMFGLGASIAASHQYGPFRQYDQKEALKLSKNILQGVGIAQQVIGSAKGLTDEGNQWNKITLQAALENTKRRQEENKSNMQRLQSQDAELKQAAKSLEESRNRSAQTN